MQWAFVKQNECGRLVRICRSDTERFQSTKTSKTRAAKGHTHVACHYSLSKPLGKAKVGVSLESKETASLIADPPLLVNGRQARLIRVREGRRCRDSFHLGTLWTRTRSRAQDPVLCVSLGMPKEWYLCLGREQWSAFGVSPLPQRFPRLP